jgi:FkbM family methyltransferase
MLLRARKALGATRLVRRVTGWEPVGRVLALAACARAFTEPLRFAVAELRSEAGVCSYTLRDSRMTLMLRHRTGDVSVVAEIFAERVYEPPPQAAAAVDALRRPPRILDLGANVGMFGAFALGRWPGATVLAYEPDPENVAVHRLTCAANPSASWQLVEAAAATCDGERRLRGGRYAESALVVPGEDGFDAAVRVSAVDVMPRLAGADIVKIDIEGGEWELLGDLRIGGTTALVLALEYHARHCPSADPKTAAREALSRIGYETIEVPLPGAVDGQGMLWGWRRAD